MNRTFHSDNLKPHLGVLDGWEERWLEAFGSHAARRFETRALVRVSVGGSEPVALSYIYALHGGGLILVVADDKEITSESGHSGGHHDGKKSATPAERELWSRGRGTGTHEIWISSPDQAVFHVERAEEGAFSTGFGRLGMSRTPDLILPRTTATPPPKNHQDHF